MDSTQAELELSVIKKIMEDSRKAAHDNGWHYIFWGALVSISLVANYILALMRINMKYAGLMWFIAMTTGAIIGAIIERKDKNKRRAHTFAGKMLGSLWFASGISMFIFGFVGTMTGAYNPVFICPVVSTALGVAYYTSGALQQIKWLKNLSYGWWTGAVLLFIFPSVHTLLIFAVMMIVFQITPGIILNNNYKNQLMISENNNG
jgi:hypothetical protein